MNFNDKMEMMKRFYFMIMLLCIHVAAFAQVKNGFILYPKGAQTLEPEQEMTISLHYAPIIGKDPLKSMFGIELSPYVIRWTVNGKNMNELSPADGSLSFVHSFDLSAVKYKAPAISPAKNPVAIAVEVKAKDNSTIWLVCNVTIQPAQYKITLEAEQTLPLIGQDIMLHGQCYANLKTAVDGTYFLEPLDKTRNMQIKVEKAVSVEKDGTSKKLISPMIYSIPFLFTVDKLDKAHPMGNATMNLYYTSPQKGQVVWKIQGDGHTIIRTVDIDKGTLTYSPGNTVQLGVSGNSGQNSIAMATATELELIAGIRRMNIRETIDNAHRNMSGSEDMKDMALRMQAHEKDPNYFKTKQGEADLQKLMALRQKIGGIITNTSTKTKNINAKINDQYANNPDYINSKAFKADREEAMDSKGEDAFRTQGQATVAEVTPEGALLRIEGKFNSNNSQAFLQEVKGTSIGGGEQTATFKIKVEKIK